MIYLSIILAAILAAAISAFNDTIVIERALATKFTVNHWILASIRITLYALLIAIVGFWQGWLPTQMIAGWFLVVPVHRLVLNHLMNWHVWHIGKTSRYDRIVNRLSKPIGANPGQLATAVEVLVFAVLMIVG